MELFIRVRTNDTCEFTSIERGGLSIQELAEMYTEEGELLLDFLGLEKPECPIDAMMYDREKRVFYEDKTKRLPETLKALNSLHELDDDHIMEMGPDYILLVHALEHRMNNIVVRMMTRIEAAGYEGAGAVRMILEQTNHKLVQDLAPF